MAGENIFIFNSSSLITKDIQSFLIDEGYNIEVINGFYDLKKILEYKKPDLYILEVVSITTELINILETIGKMAEFRNLPCIAVLNRAKQDIVFFLGQSGFQEILTKPIDKNLLLQVIDRLATSVEEGDFRIGKELMKNGFIVIEFLDHLDV